MAKPSYNALKRENGILKMRIETLSKDPVFDITCQKAIQFIDLKQCESIVVVIFNHKDRDTMVRRIVRMNMSASIYDRAVLDDKRTFLFFSTDKDNTQFVERLKATLSKAGLYDVCIQEFAMHRDMPFLDWKRLVEETHYIHNTAHVNGHQL